MAPNSLLRLYFLIYFKHVCNCSLKHFFHWSIFMMTALKFCRQNKIPKSFKEMCSASQKVFSLFHSLSLQTLPFSAICGHIHLLQQWSRQLDSQGARLSRSPRRPRRRSSRPAGGRPSARSSSSSTRRPPSCSSGTPTTTTSLFWNNLLGATIRTVAGALEVCRGEQCMAEITVELETWEFQELWIKYLHWRNRFLVMS